MLLINDILIKLKHISYLMATKYCRHMKSVPETPLEEVMTVSDKGTIEYPEDAVNDDDFKCRLTGKDCVASPYRKLDLKHLMPNCCGCVLHVPVIPKYDDDLAKCCPAYEIQ